MFERIVDIVRDRFAERNLSYEVVGGIDSRNASDNFGPGGSNRVAFVVVPEGEFTPAMFIGDAPDDSGDVARQLFTMPIGFDICCATFDPDALDNDIKNTAACVRLWEKVAQEIHRAYAGQYGLVGFKFDDERKQGRFGAELIVRIAMNVPINDAPWRAVVAHHAALDQPENKR